MTNTTLVRFEAATQHALNHAHSGHGCGRPVMQTGYYGRPGSSNTKVHVRLAGERGPLCKATLRGDMAFQWCANRAEMEYNECASCKALLIKAIKAEQGTALMASLSFMPKGGMPWSAHDRMTMDRGHALRMGDYDIAKTLTLKLLGAE